MICNICLCNSCINNVNTITAIEEEIKECQPCFNCDDCYWYGMDNDKLTKNNKSECKSYRITSHNAKLKRNRFKDVNRGR